MRDIQELSYSEIADALRLPEGHRSSRASTRPAELRGRSAAARRGFSSITNEGVAELMNVTPSSPGASRSSASAKRG
jgi:hypothetical protein